MWKPEERITPEEALKHRFFSNSPKQYPRELSQKIMQKGIPDEENTEDNVEIFTAANKRKGKSLAKKISNKTLVHPPNEGLIQGPKNNIKLQLNSFMKLKNPQPQTSKGVSKQQISLMQIPIQSQKQTKDYKAVSSEEKKEKSSEKKTLLLHVLAKKTIPIKYSGSKKS